MKRSRHLGLLVVPAMVMSLCVLYSSSPESSASQSEKTYTLGVLTDLTGPAASTELSVPLGVKAGVGLANKEGYHIKYVVADGGTSPTGELTAAQKLVEQDHVFAVVAVDALTFAAAPYLNSNGIPVIGADVDGNEWITDSNMFPTDDTNIYKNVYSVFGKFLKKEGVTNIAVLGYGITPSSALSTKSTAASAAAEGIKVGYLNADFPFGSTNVAPIALAIKTAGSNGFYTGTETSTSFAMIEALKQDGVQMKVSLLPIGYGGDLLQGGPDAKQAAQGVYFEDAYEPVEMHTAATEQFQSALKTYAGVTGDPTSNEYYAYVAINEFITGLKAAGADPTQASLIKAMLKITNYNADGLLGDHGFGLSLSQRAQGFGPVECGWETKFEGDKFQLVPGADPICGPIDKGKTVS